MEKILEIRKLNLGVGDFSLKDVSFSLEENDFLVLLGPTGSGKSILLKALAGFYRTGMETIFLENKDISRLVPEKRSIGYVSQHNDLFPHMDVYANIVYSLKYRGIDRTSRDRRVQKYLDFFEISHLASRDVRTLSGGEAKKVMLARTLASEPEILLLDEPLGMLDHNARLRMLDTLRRIHDELQLTIIQVSHDRSEAWNIGEKCAVINDGSIEQLGSTSSLFRKPENIFVAEFLGGENIFPSAFSEKEYPTAEASWGKLRILQLPDFPHGYIQIRPEALSFSGEDRFSINGKVSSCIDMGEYCEIVISPDGDGRVKLYEDHRKSEEIKLGDTVSVSYRPGDIHIFR